MRQTIVALLAILVLSLILVTCFAPGRFRSSFVGEPPVPLGPIPFRSIEQLEEYMIRTWRGPVETSAYRPTPPEGAPPANRFWQFREDGTFSAWAEEPLDGEGLFNVDGPEGPQRYEGRWSVSHHVEPGVDPVHSQNTRPVRLHLTDVAPAPPGSDDGSITLPLRWIDGKFRIEINGRRYFVHSRD